MSASIARGSLVVVAGRLGRVIATDARLGPAKGYSVAACYPQPGDGYLPHFAQDWQVKPAVVGVNVCPQPRGTHSCGLVHAQPRELEELAALPPSKVDTDDTDDNEGTG